MPRASLYSLPLEWLAMFGGHTMPGLVWPWLTQYMPEMEGRARSIVGRFRLGWYIALDSVVTVP